MRFAKDIRKQSGGSLGDEWHFDEAVGRSREGNTCSGVPSIRTSFVLEMLVQNRRSAKAAKRLIERFSVSFSYTTRLPTSFTFTAATGNLAHHRELRDAALKTFSDIARLDAA
ncbi:transposase-like protein [Rhizobium sp. BK313]|uniref:hypothetical protein n=1 Tax=Rhizobium sp. BK313 TaxID=2587081 RepID=UPI0010604D6B|nr:hypothetical protein [Rhizobium sp. BK313]MBB3457214.1 transposase-like protein [Rhizobium sp. BK313]